MTEREARIRRAVATVERAFPTGTGGWAKERFSIWVDVVVDLEPEHVEAGAAELVRGWTSTQRPFPGHLRSHALAARSADGGPAANGTLPGDVGQGCPECRHADERGTWVSDRTVGLTHCMTHRVAWRGLLPEPGDPGEVPSGLLRTNVDALVKRLAAARRLR